MGHSILHLLPDRDAALAKVQRLLKPGGVFISSTVCLGDHMSYMAPVLSVMRIVGRWPMVKLLKVEGLLDEFEAAGLKTVHHWQPAKNKAVFVVSQKQLAS